MAAIDRDDKATWAQLRDRLREIRVYAEALDGEGDPAGRGVLNILDRPRETT